MASRETTLDMARAIGTVGAGLGTGMMASIVVLTMPALRAVPSISETDNVRYWSKIFDLGMRAIGTLQVASSSALLLAAYLAPSPPAALATLAHPRSSLLRTVAANRRTAILAAAACQLSIPLFTAAFMAPTIRKLKQAEHMADSTPEVKMQDTPRLLESWERMHVVRIALSATGFSIALLELMACGSV